MCYFPSGEAWWRSDGKEVITRPGYFMWRPARAATQRARALTDAVTICAFGPARDTEWGHQLSQEEIAERDKDPRSEEHTSELQSLMRISYAVFCLKKKKN